ncbi:hypothetical protein LL250_09370, partial [Halomonas meridiana]|nr:hypothetical protein [Halomonas meridiana]
RDEAAHGDLLSSAMTVVSISRCNGKTDRLLGIAVLPHFLAQEAGLVCIASDLGVDQPIYLVIQTDLTQSRRTRAGLSY